MTFLIILVQVIPKDQTAIREELERIKAERMARRVQREAEERTPAEK